MQNRILKNVLSNTIYLGLITTTTLLPLAPISSFATEVKNNTATVSLDDQSNTQIPEKISETTAIIIPAETTDTAQTTTTAVLTETTETTTPVETTETSETPETASKNEGEGMSTGMKYTLGIGGTVVALVGIAALASGGSSDSSPTPPTEEQMVGPWQANANSIDGRTYTGTYTLYTGGSHRYDIYVSDGQHKVGSGAWKLVDYDLEIRNYSGSTYRGTFDQGVKNTVTTYTTDGRWKDILTK